MIFNAQIDFVRDAERIARKHHLIQCTERNLLSVIGIK
jgi:hypothetical protein